MTTTAPGRSVDETALQMHAHAHLRTELATGSRRTTRLAVLRSQAPLKLRPSIARGLEAWAPYSTEPARVCLAASGAGPMGGDDLHLDIEVGAGTTLLLSEASATVVLPGVGPGTIVSRLRVRAQVAAGATLVWLPEPVITARGCHHINDIAVELAADARLMMREELLLGRHGEAAGRVQQKLRVRRNGRPLLAQDLDLGGETLSSPAVVGAHRAIGSLLVVDPALPAVEATPLAEDGTLLPLAVGGAVLAQALSADSIGMRAQLTQALHALGAPWEPSVRHTAVPTTLEGR